MRYRTAENVRRMAWGRRLPPRLPLPWQLAARQKPCRRAVPARSPINGERVVAIALGMAGHGEPPPHRRAAAARRISNRRGARASTPLVGSHLNRPRCPDDGEAAVRGYDWFLQRLARSGGRWRAPVLWHQRRPRRRSRTHECSGGRWRWQVQPSIGRRGRERLDGLGLLLGVRHVLLLLQACNKGRASGGT